jgi:hypothetical protein
MNREDVKDWSSINDEYNDIHDHDDKEDLNECEHCKGHGELNISGLCDECKDIDFCDCGEDRQECSHCGRDWFEVMRDLFVKRFETLVL